MKTVLLLCLCWLATPVILSQDTAAAPLPITIEQMPEFPGGAGALKAFLDKELRYPPDAAREGIEGRVVVRFNVETDGSLQHIEVIRRLTPATDQEAIRLVDSMPCWVPGKNNGQPARTVFYLPITFRLA